MNIAPSWDLFISIFFIVAIMYGIALGRERSVANVIATYIALVVANVGGNFINTYMGSSAAANVGNAISVTANTSPFALKAGIFGIVVLLLIVKGDFVKKADTSHAGFGSILLAGFYSFLAAGMLVNSIMSFLGDSMRTELLEQSQVLNQIVSYHVGWMVVPTLLMIFLGFRKKEE